MHSLRSWAAQQRQAGFWGPYFRQACTTLGPCSEASSRESATAPSVDGKTIRPDFFPGTCFKGFGSGPSKHILVQIP